MRSELPPGSHEASFLDLRSSAGVSQAGRRKGRPDLCRAIRGSGPGFEPVTFGQRHELIRLHFWSKSRQSDHRRAEKHENRKG